MTTKKKLGPLPQIIGVEDDDHVLVRGHRFSGAWGESTTSLTGSRGGVGRPSACIAIAVSVTP